MQCEVIKALHGDVQKAQTLPIFFLDGYHNAQDYKNIIILKINNACYIPLEINNQEAKSLPFSLFGSIFCTESDFSHTTLDLLFQWLQSNGMKSLEVTHPAEIYSDFIDGEAYLPFANNIKSDYNQHLVLDENIVARMHNMEKRHWNHRENITITFSDDYSEAHDLLKQCRTAQGLEINISKEKLMALSRAFPERYEIMLARISDEIAAVVIFVKVTSEVVYYYLPGTISAFRKQSPMVPLLTSACFHYRKRGFKYLDLGISSLNGRKQEGLFGFKERMGAVKTNKVTYYFNL